MTCLSGSSEMSSHFIGEGTGSTGEEGDTGSTGEEGDAGSTGEEGDAGSTTNGGGAGSTGVSHPANTHKTRNPAKNAQQMIFLFINLIIELPHSSSQNL
jgi:hypothetical protein